VSGRPGFARALLFAAMAAAGFVPFDLVCSPWLGSAGAFVAYAVGSAAACALGIAPSRRRGLGAALLVAAGGATAAGLAADPRDAVLAAALLLAAVRSGLLYPARLGRALWVEAALVGGGLALASQFPLRGAASGALAVWSFFLVQSVFSLVGGARRRREPAGGGDTFARARDRLEAALAEAERGGGAG
jgi:hypothetical protein